MAENLYKYIIARCKEHIDIVEQGEFGADMKVELVNDGPLQSYWTVMNYNYL